MRLKLARPKADVDENVLTKLARMQCTNEEIAAFFDVSVDTIERRFAGTIKRARLIGVSSMKRQLFKLVQDGNLGAIVWWGKNYANMSDKVDSNVKANVQVTESEIHTDTELKDKLNVFLTQRISKK